MISISLADSLNNINHPPRKADLSEPDFLKLFHTDAYKITRRKNSAQVWMPCTFTYPSREAEYVSEISAFVVDCDKFTEQDLHNTVLRLTTSGHKFLLHSSYGYLPPLNAKVRIIFFLNEPITVGTHWRWSLGMWPKLTEYLGFDAKSADYSCSDASRAFFLPIKQSRVHPTLSKFYDGVPLDTKEILKDVLSKPSSLYDFRRTYVSREDPDRPVPFNEVKLRLKVHFAPKSDYGKAVKAVLEKEATPEGSRHQTLRLFTHALARVAEPHEASEVLVTIMHPWLEGLGSRGNESEALRALQGARDKLPSWNAYAAAKLQAQLGWFDGK